MAAAAQESTRVSVSDLSEGKSVVTARTVLLGGWGGAYLRRVRRSQTSLRGQRRLRRRGRRLRRVAMAALALSFP